MEPLQTSRVAVIGGGISGLAAAHRLRELAPEVQVTLFEGSDRLGGVLGTERRDGFLIERSADMFTTREPWALRLCERLGIADQLITTNSQQRRAFVVSQGWLVDVPEGFTLMSPAKPSAILSTPLLTWRGKLRLASEYFVRRRRDLSDESLASFATRRFGREAFERLIQPLIGGIYTADPTRLSLAATLPQFLEMEREHGSVIRATRKQQKAAGAQEKTSGARYGMFVAPREGMQTLVDALAGRLPPESVRLDATVQRLSAQLDGSWLVHSSSGVPETFDAVILATKAPVAGRLLMATSPTLATDLQHLPYAGAAVVVLGVCREQISHPLNGFGFVVPAVENRRILAGSFSSVKFAGRAPEGYVLLRVFVGGALQPELLRLDDDAIQQLVREELRELIGFTGEPLFSQVQRWTGAMPQYHVGHLQLIDTIERHASALPNFALAGNAYRGVGIPFCIRSGELAAESIVARLRAQAAV